jgi:hypothetical protein
LRGSRPPNSRETTISASPTVRREEACFRQQIRRATALPSGRFAAPDQ